MKKKRLQALIVVALMVMSAVFAIALLTIEEDDGDKYYIENVEASGNGVTIGDVGHSPSEPSAGGHVDYYAKIDGLPSEYTILLVTESYDNNSLRSTFRSCMRKISSITFKDTDILNDDDSGFTVKYRIYIYDQEIDDLDELEYLVPILESDLHTYVVK